MLSRSSLHNILLTDGLHIFPLSQVIVVGGGLGGMSAAHTVLQQGGRVLVLDKVCTNMSDNYVLFSQFYM